jgi:hypothetical protein
MNVARTKPVACRNVTGGWPRRPLPCIKSHAECAAVLWTHPNACARDIGVALCGAGDGCSRAIPIPEFTCLSSLLRARGGRVGTSERRWAVLPLPQLLRPETKALILGKLCFLSGVEACSDMQVATLDPKPTSWYLDRLGCLSMRVNGVTGLNHVTHTSRWVIDLDLETAG